MIYMNENTKEMKKYLNLSLELSKKQFLERSIFEIEMHFDLFDNKEGYRIESLISDCCMNMCLSDKVFEQLIEQALLFYNKNHKNKLKNTGKFICLC